MPPSPPYIPASVIAEWGALATASLMMACAVCMRVKNRLRPAKQMAIRTYDEKRIEGRSKDDATTAALVAQAYVICTALDFFCYPCWLIGCFSKEGGHSRYQTLDEEAGGAGAANGDPEAPDSYRQQIWGDKTPPRRGFFSRGPRSQSPVKTTRKMWENWKGDHSRIQPRNFEPPAAALPQVDPAALAAAQAALAAAATAAANAPPPAAGAPGAARRPPGPRRRGSAGAAPPADPAAAAAPGTAPPADPAAAAAPGAAPPPLDGAAAAGSAGPAAAPAAAAPEDDDAVVPVRIDEDPVAAAAAPPVAPAAAAPADPVAAAAAPPAAAPAARLRQRRHRLPRMLRLRRTPRPRRPPPRRPTPRRLTPRRQRLRRPPIRCWRRECCLRACVHVLLCGLIYAWEGVGGAGVVLERTWAWRWGVMCSARAMGAVGDCRVAVEIQRGVCL